MDWCAFQAELDKAKRHARREIGRHLRRAERQRRPAGEATTPAAAAGPRQALAAKGKAETRPWTQRGLDEAIRQYKAQRGRNYVDLCEAVKAGNAGARKKAQEVYGRNAIARALRVKSKAMVSKSPAWVAIAAELELPLRRNRGAMGTRHTRRPGKVGHDIAIEEKSAQPAEGASNAPADQPLETAERQETYRYLNHLSASGRSAEERRSNKAGAGEMLKELRRGEKTDGEVREVVVELAGHPSK
jgi:hypothetical protein